MRSYERSLLLVEDLQLDFVGQCQPRTDETGTFSAGGWIWYTTTAFRLRINRLLRCQMTRYQAYGQAELLALKLSCSNRVRLEGSRGVCSSRVGFHVLVSDLLFDDVGSRPQ